MKDYLIKRPMLLCAILCSVVAILGYNFKFSLLVFALLSTVCLVYFILVKASIAKFIVVLSVMLMIVSMLFEHGQADSLEKFAGKSLDCSFVVSDITYENSDFCSADVEILDSNVLKRGTKINVLYYSDILKIGDVAKGVLKISSVCDDKYKAYYYSRGVFSTATLNEFVKIPGKTDFVLKTVGNIRDYIRNTFFSNMKYSNASTVTGIMLGNNKYFTQSFSYNVRASGVSHAMVVSGMHLSVFVLLITYLSERIIYNKYLRALLMAFAVVFIIAICGFTASMIRAGTVYLLMALALVLGRKGTPENTLGTAVTLILLISPFIILDMGFQLSVLSTFGLLAVALPVMNTIRSRELIKGKFVFGLVSAVITSLSAMLITAPVLIYSFGHISTPTVITNLLTSFVVNLVFGVGVLGLVCNIFIPAVAKLLFSVCELLIIFMNSVINYFGSLEYSYLPVSKFVAFAVFFLIIVIFYAMLACKKRIDMLKLKEMCGKIISEGGKRLKWR